MKSITSNIRISPKKLNLVAEMIRRKSVVQADALLKFTTKRAAEIVRKALASATANAENNFKQNRDELYVEEVIVGKGPSLKRFNPVSRGRAHPILKRMSMITVKVGVLGGNDPAEKMEKTDKKESVEESKKTTTKEVKEVKAVPVKKSSVKVTKKS